MNRKKQTIPEREISYHHTAAGRIARVCRLADGTYRVECKRHAGARGQSTVYQAEEAAMSAARAFLKQE